MSEPVKCPESDERCGWTWTVSGSERVCRQPSDSIWHNHSPACPPDCNQDADACHPFTPNSPEKPDSCHVPVLIYSDKYCESCGDRIEDHPNPSGEPNGSAEPQEMTFEEFIREHHVTCIPPCDDDCMAACWNAAKGGR